MRDQLTYGIRPPVRSARDADVASTRVAGGRPDLVKAQIQDAVERNSGFARRAAPFRDSLEMVATDGHLADVKRDLLPPKRRDAMPRRARLDTARPALQGAHRWSPPVHPGIAFLVLLLAAFAGRAPAATVATLPGGAHLVVEERPASETVAIRIEMGGGSFDDPEDRRGLAELHARLLSRGTKRKTASELAAAAERLGARLATFASLRSETIAIDVPADGLEPALSLVAEILHAPRLDAADLEKEKGLVIGSLAALEDDPSSFLSDEVFRVLFPGHPFSRMVRLRKEEVRAVTIEAVRGFHADRLEPRRIALIAVGRCTAAEVASMAGPLFAASGSDSEHGSLALPARSVARETRSRPRRPALPEYPRGPHAARPGSDLPEQPRGLAAGLDSARPEQPRRDHGDIVGSKSAPRPALDDPVVLLAAWQRISSQAEDDVPGSEIPGETGPIRSLAPREVPTPAPLADGIHRRVRKRTTQAEIMIALPTEGIRDEDAGAYALLRQVLGGFQERLYSEIREKRGYAYWVTLEGLALPTAGWFGVHTGARPKNLEDIEAVVRAELARIAAEPVAAEELERARRFLTTAEARLDATNEGRASLLAAALVEGRPLRSYEERVARLAAVRPEQVRDLARRLFAGKAFAVVTLH